MNQTEGELLKWRKLQWDVVCEVEPRLHEVMAWVRHDAPLTWAEGYEVFKRRVSQLVGWESPRNSSVMYEQALGYLLWVWENRREQEGVA